MFRRSLKALFGQIKPVADLAAVHIRGGDTIGFRGSTSDGVTTEAQVDVPNLSHVIDGPSPQGEADTLPTCRRLIAFLNKQGGTWGEPVGTATAYTDCEAPDCRNHLPPLQVQVVRAVAKATFWSRLARKGDARRDLPVQQVALELREAIEHKVTRIPPDERSRLVLALDANRVPGHALTEVVDVFRKEHGESVRQHGFKMIYIVGPVDALIHRVDQ